MNLVSASFCSFEPHNYHCVCASFGTTVTDDGPTAMVRTQNSCSEFRTIKQTRCTNFSISFWNETLHVSDSTSVYRQEYFTVHTAKVYVIQVCGQLASRIRMFNSDPTCSCPQTGMTCTIVVCTVKYS